MILLKNNLVAIAYKTGYCGSLVYALCAMSPEVQQYMKFDDLTFENGTAHEVGEQWFNDLHDYRDSLEVCEQNWPNYLTSKAKQALTNDGLVMFRCHPNIANKLAFIENLKVLYLTHRNKYLPERWAYEKVYKPRGDDFYQQDLQRLFGTQKVFALTNQIKRTQLIKNLNHQVVSWQQIQNNLRTTPFLVKIDRLLDKDYLTYVELCNYLKISPMDDCKFYNIISKYNQRQWKRF